MLTQIGELENLVVHKQKMTDDLVGQMEASVREKEAKLSAMSIELNELRLAQSQERGARRSASPSDLRMNVEMAGGKSGSGLEEKLRNCHEKCEMVVDTLSQLKVRNENLNNRIRSYREGLNGQIV